MHSAARAVARWLPTPFAAAVAAVGALLILVPLVSLSVWQMADRADESLLEEVTPISQAADRVYIDVLALVGEANRYALSRTERDSEPYRLLLASYDLHARQLRSVSRGTDFEPQATDLLALSDQVVESTSSAVEAKENAGGTGGELELLYFAPPMLRDFRTAANQMQRDMDTRSSDLFDENRFLSEVGLYLSVAGSFLGAGGVAVLAMVAVSRRRALRSSNRDRARLDGMVQASGSGVLQIRPTGHIDYLNPAAAEMLGYTVEALAGKRLAAIVRDPGESELCEAVETSDSYLGEEHFVRADGEAFLVHASSAPVVVGDEPAGSVLVFQDLSPLMERTKRREEFLAMASHELRSPLTSIVGFSRRLARRLRAGGLPADDDVAEEVQTIQQQAERMARIVELFLDLARLEADVLVIEPEPLEVRRMLSREVALLRARYPEAVVVAEIPDTPMIVESDELRLSQIFTNLLDNAVQHGGDPPYIHVQAIPEHQGVAVRVRDNGPGIPDGDRVRIFERFFSAPQGSRGRSVGLGLHISNELAGALGAQLEVGSKPGEGAEFRLWLPREVNRRRRGRPGAQGGTRAPTVVRVPYGSRPTRQSSPASEATGARESSS